MAEFSIRTARPADLAELDALFARSYPKLLKPDYPPSVLVTALPLISRAQPALLASGSYFVVQAGTGVLLGAGGWSRSRKRGEADVRHVVTDADHLRLGVARALMSRVLETARGAGIVALNCQSTYTAVPFYRAMGFAEIGPVEVELRPGILFPAIRMRREI